MLYLIKWLYMWLLPLGGIVAALFAVVGYMYYRRAKGRHALAVVIGLLYFLSIAPVSNLLIQPLEQAYSQVPLNALQGDVVILLGGGARAGVPDVDGTGQIGEAAANRFLTAVRIQRAKNIPILLSGGAAFVGDAEEAVIEKRMLLSLGVPETQIFTDTKSRNTAENAKFSRTLSMAHGWSHAIVVTSAFHMPRAVQFFTREGMQITPYPSDYRTSAAERITAFSFIPQAYVLMNSCLAIKEYVGIGAVWLGLQ